MMNSWLQALTVYGQKRIILIGMLGFSSGVPLLLTSSVLGFWLSKEGVNITTIGIFALVGMPYALKFLWSPIIDKASLSFITRYFGQRRGWSLLCQVLLMVAIFCMGQVNPLENQWLIGLLALSVAFLSASQDIVIDALRIELLKDNEQGAGSAVTVSCYRLAMLVAGAGSLSLSDYVPWSVIFLVNSLLVLVGIIAVLMIKEPNPEAPKHQSFSEFIEFAVLDPFRNFFVKENAWVILIFIIAYKFGDVFSGVMAFPFYKELGFTGLEIGGITKGLGIWMTLLGVFCGGVLVARNGILPSLLWGGIAQAVTNIFFVLLAIYGKDLYILTATIAFDNFAGGIGQAALVAYLSTLTNKYHTATQYALLTSFMALGRTVFSSGSGYVAQELGWASFFGLSIILAIPGLMLLLYLRKMDKNNAIG